jgi:hypothetical protein
VLAIAAIAVAVWLWRQLAAERARASELLYEKLDIENRMDALHTQQQADAASETALDEVATHLIGPLHAVQADLENADQQLGEYRARVRDFDTAVQYCLQPVELIFGADKAALDRLVSHVEGARRKLFEARTAVEKHPLHKGSETLGGSVGEVRMLSDYAHSLRVAAVLAPDDEAPAGADAAETPPAAAANG